MKTQSKNILKISAIVLSTSLLLNACGASKSEMEAKEEAYKQDAISSTSESSTIGNGDATDNSLKKEDASKNSTTKDKVASWKFDSTRSFIRKADMHFRVKNVKETTFDIEEIVAQHHGYVTTSNLESNINYKNSVRINKDSVKEELHYTVHSNLILRVKNEELDSTLIKIATLVDYLDYRKVNANDVTKTLASSALLQNRYAKHQQRVENTIDSKGKKLNSTLEAEDGLLSKQGISDEDKLDANEIKYDINYSTVVISIYQPEATKIDVYAVALPIEPYKPSFGSEMVTSLQDSGKIFSAILLFLIKSWPIALLIIGIILLIKIIVKRKWIA
jgi:Domain of unknown function (DUF4349)